MLFIAKVLDAGRINEFDKPYNLLKSKKNLLYKLVAQTGGVEAQKLFEMARRAYFSKQNGSSKKKSDKNENNTDEVLQENVTPNFSIPSITILPETEDDYETTPV